MDNKYASLKIENQVCFPLYACSKEVVKRYKPYLEPLDLTYTQYIIMMVMWERREVMLKELGSALYLDSGTLTPVLKKMEAKGLVRRTRVKDDERNLMITLTDEGLLLRERALEVPKSMSQCVKLSAEETITLYKLLYKLLGTMDEE